MTVQYLRCAGSGAKIAVWFRCSLNKQTTDGNRAHVILNRESAQDLEGERELYGKTLIQLPLKALDEE